MRASVLEFMKGCDSGEGDGREIVFGADLAAFEVYREAFNQRIGGMCAAERSAWCEWGNHFDGLYTKRPGGIAGGVTSGEHDSADLGLRNGGMGDHSECGTKDARSF